MAIINISVSNFLALTQTTDAHDSNIPFVVGQSLVLTQHVRVSWIKQDVNQPFNISQAVGLRKTQSISVANQLAIHQIMGRSTAIAVTSNLFITQVAAKVNPQSAANILHILQSVIPSYALGSSIVIHQNLSHTKSVVRGPSQTLTLLSRVAVVKVDAINTYNIVVPDPVDTTAVIFSLGSESVTLTIPEIGDVDKIDVSRVEEQTRGGDLIIYRDPIWPVTEILKMKFTTLSRIVSDEFLHFMMDTIGQQVTMIDWQGVTWLGIITTPDAQRMCNADNSCGLYEIEIEFQGVKA